MLEVFVGVLEERGGATFVYFRAKLRFGGGVTGHCRFAVIRHRTIGNLRTTRRANVSLRTTSMGEFPTTNHGSSSTTATQRSLPLVEAAGKAEGLAGRGRSRPGAGRIISMVESFLL